jgi:broad specificity phosphatase PhoE
VVLVIRVHLVRHGRAAAGWDTDPDPGLDDLGREQAAATASRLAGLASTGVEHAVVTSPLRRCRETAGFLLERWGWPADRMTVVDAVREIPSPPGIPMPERVEWLRRAMTGSWTDLGSPYIDFRDGVVDFVRSRTGSVVVFSHFIAINAVIGACLGDDRVVIDSLDNASVTVVEVGAGGDLHLVERGRQADTLIR